MRLKLRTKFIVLFVMVALLPLLAGMMFTIVRVQGIERDNAIQLNQSIAETAAKEVESFVLFQFQMLQNIGTVYPQFAMRPHEEQLTFLEQYLFASPYITEISIATEEGQEVLRQHIFEVVRPDRVRDISGTEKFQQAKEQGIYVGSIAIQRGRPHIELGRAIVNRRGEFSGAVFAIVDARIMQAAVQQLSRNENEKRAYIVDREGIVIAHPDAATVLLEQDFSRFPPVRILQDAEDGQHGSVYENEQGERVLGAGVPIVISIDTVEGEQEQQIIPWFLIVEKPESVAFAAVQGMTQIAGSIFLGVLLLGVTGAVVFAGSIVGPIEALHGAAQKFGKGKLDYRVTIRTRDEIEELAYSFNAMAEKLSNSIKRLKKDRELIEGERNKLASIVSGIKDAVIVTDLERRITLFNDAASLLTGYQEHEVIGRPIDEILEVRRENQPVAANEYCPRLSGEERIVFAGSSLALSGKMGKEAVVDMVVGQILEGAEVGIGCIITIHDVTREKVLERIKTEFIAIAAHQLRTPLSGVKWALDMLVAGDLGQLKPQQKRIMERIYANNQHMIQLVNDLLDATQTEEGKFVGKLESGNLKEVVQALMKEYEQKAAQKGLTFLLREETDTLPKVKMDKGKIKLALQNLLENAINYTPFGGTVELSLGVTEEGVECAVRDTGIGIPRQVMPQIFSKFFRARNAVSEVTEGSGLGLYITKNIVRAHNGDIRFDSEEGKGSVFIITLPIAKKKSSS